MKKIGLILLCLFVLYVAYLYITGRRETFLVPKGYEGVLLIIGNQKDGIEINKNNAIYDFTKSNIIKLKGDLITGFSPWGYLNYYEVDDNGNKNKIEEINDEVESADVKENKVYMWEYYFEIGSCEVRDNGKKYYEALVVSKKTNAKTIAINKQQLINKEVCYKKATQ
jgi:hypothetical protein